MELSEKDKKELKAIEKIKMVIEKINLPNTKIKMLQRLLSYAIEEFKKVNKIMGVEFSDRLKRVVDQILTDEYLEELNNLRDMPSGKQYCELCHTVSGILKNGENGYKNFPEFSLAAWTTTKSKKEDTPVEEASDSTYWPSLEEYNPNISADEWVLFLQEDKKSYPSTLEMLKAMLELGGEATCKRVAELLGEHPSSCVSRGNTLGRRAKNQFNLPPCMDGEKERYCQTIYYR